MKTRGILILAMGHPYYGRMAFNLAVSIKNIDPSTQIALVYAGEALRHLRAQPIDRYFDQMIMAPAASYLHKGKEVWIKAKTWMYDLSPFDETLLLDADTLWLNRSPQELFTSLEAVKITIANRGAVDMETLKPAVKPFREDAFWCAPDLLKQAYQFQSGLYYSLSSEVVYFKRSEEIKNYFEWVKDVWENPLIEPRAFAGAAPDEFAFAVAGIMCNLYPHASPWLPSYWVRENPRMAITDADLHNYYTYSIGGNVTTDRQKEYYNRRARAIFQKMGLQHPYQVKDKRSFLEERKKI